MKVRIRDSKGKVVKELVLHSMNHYEMVINGLKANNYNVEFIDGSRVETRTIRVK